MSRLTTLRPCLKADTKALSSMNFRDMGGWHLVTNDWGHYLMLDTKDFERVVEGKVTPEDSLYPELESRGFIKDRLDFDFLAKGHA